jgi:hypothetical protein
MEVIRVHTENLRERKMKHRGILSAALLATAASFGAVEPSFAWPQLPDVGAADRDTIVSVEARGMGGGGMGSGGMGGGGMGGGGMGGGGMGGGGMGGGMGK